MKINFKNKNGGFITKIIILIVAIALLKYFFDFDFFAWLSTSGVKTFFFKIWDIIVFNWENYLREPVVTLFKFISDFIKSIT